MEEKNYKYEQCNDCIYTDPQFMGDCEKCVNGSAQVTSSDFMADMEIWNEEAPTPEEEKPKYFPIRWLIRKILKVESENCCIWFGGITTSPRGEKQRIDGEYSLLFRLYFPFVYIWQHTDGGYTGDDFAGVMYFRLFPFVWLSFGYEC